jgi:putative endopeptidase
MSYQPKPRGTTAVVLLCAILASHGGAVLVDEPVLPYTPSLDVTAMDRSIDPCVDLYQYSCGAWQRNNPIPPDQTSWSVYRRLAEDNLTFLRGVLQEAAVAQDRDAVTAQIGDYYSACMDEQAVERAGAAPIRESLTAITTAHTPVQIARVIARLQRAAHRRSVLFNAGSQLDPDDSEQQIASLDQGGLGLPERDYYFREDAKSKQIRVRYVEHVARMLQLLGDFPAAARVGATRIMALETALAKASLKKVERRDPYKLKHKIAPTELDRVASGFAWSEYFTELGSPPLTVVNVQTPGFFKEMGHRLRSGPIETWRAYLRFHVANGAAPTLSRSFVEEDFYFYDKYLTGAQQIKPRWKRCAILVDGQLGEDLGQAFVRKVFTRQSKEAALAMVHNIEAIMERRLGERDWMSPRTRAAALAKLQAIRNKIGYPEKWRDYSSVHIARDDFAGNVARASSFEFDRQLHKIGQPVDHDEWAMTPPTVNAYFDPTMNDINFPAGVLQPPLYDPGMDDAPNYGNTGATIGHELTHGFDDEGRKFDAHGNLKDWWTKEDAARFTQRARCVSDQYAQYVVVDDIHINSALSLGEDIADLGGEVLAYEAWKAAVAGATLEDRDGLTPEQRFFVGFAQWACENVRPEQAREHARTDPHSPGRYRINGVVVNMPEFERAFHCPKGAPMTKPEDKICVIW